MIGTEAAIQRAVVQHINLRKTKGLVFFSVPNGGWRNIITAKNLKLEGVRPGVSDLIFLHQGSSYALEIKAERGRASEHQLHFLDDWRGAGGHGCVSNGLDRCLSVLETWGLIK